MRSLAMINITAMTANNVVLVCVLGVEFKYA
jgi:hypothetical protein